VHVTRHRVTVPYYRLHLPDGTGGGALGDIYVSSKIVLLDAALAERLEHR
jgi:hypothetical protein